MKEAMRLHPGVGFPLERYVPKGGLVVGDVLLPEGTIVGMNAWVIHHDKTIYGEDADMFRPERWMDAESEKLRIMEKCFLSVRLYFIAQLLGSNSHIRSLEPAQGLVLVCIIFIILLSFSSILPPSWHKEPQLMEHRKKHLDHGDGHAGAASPEEF
jgi:hypothetical protein